MSKLPHNINVLRKLINETAAKQDIQRSRFEREVANAVVFQMLPQNTVIKGGASLSAKYNIEETRESMDLDVVFAQNKTHVLSTNVDCLSEKLGMAYNDLLLEIHNERSFAPTVDDALLVLQKIIATAIAFS
jgi:hypothetical protein